VLSLQRKTQAPVADPSTLAAEEKSLADAELSLATRLHELEQREGLAAQAVEEQRRTLAQVAAPALREEAEHAASALPAAPAAHAPPAEIARALEARVAAIEARRHAIEAEQHYLSQRETALAASVEAIEGAKRTFEALRTRAAELARAEQERLARVKAEQEKAAAARAKAKAAAAARPPPPPQEPSNRREKTRVRLSTDIDLVSESNIFVGFASDLSDGGVFVATCNVVDPGTEVDVSFTLPGDKKIEATGTVRWLREFNDATPDLLPGMGIAFSRVPAEALQSIQDFMRRRDPIFFA
jgi:uncharacterized protein (TIGR02266 family)